MSDEYIFDCPECSVEVGVDAGIRSRILDGGCVLCEASVEAGDFTRLRRSRDHS
ncbi:DUF7560 family zinc ribbon protein [Haloferax elongans]